MMPFVLGVSGGSASGKTWLSQALLAAFGPRTCVHIAHDDYYLPLPEAFRHRPGDYNFDAPSSLETDLLVDHLDALLAGRPVQVPTYAFDVHDRVGVHTVHPGPLVLLEGILLLTDPRIRERLDLAVFVDAPTDVRRERRVHRDVHERGRQEAWVRDRFARHVEPMHQRHVEPTRAHADLVVDGTQALAHAVAAVIARLPDGLSPQAPHEVRGSPHPLE